MPKNHIDPAHDECVDENKRALLKNSLAAVAVATVAGTAGLAQSVLADEVTPVVAESTDDFSDIPYRESELGIDYKTLADFPVSHMLSQGEAEWMKNASAEDEYGEDAAEAWGHETVAFVGEGRVSKAMIEDLRLFTPNMLLSFGRIDPNHPKYMLLAAEGDSFQLDQYLQG